jgi:hypothetical protein
VPVGILLSLKGASQCTARDGLSACRSNAHQSYVFTLVYIRAVAASMVVVLSGTYLRANDGMHGKAEASATCRAELTAMHNVNAG